MLRLAKFMNGCEHKLGSETTVRIATAREVEDDIAHAILNANVDVDGSGALYRKQVL
jgi:hypothetical protein